MGKCRELVGEYGEQLANLSGKLLRVLSVNLGLEEKYLEEAFGGEEVTADLRVNFYPKCPQPDLTLGLSPHSDPGGLTLLLPDPHVSGLQVLRGHNWLTVKPLPNAIIVNIGDQIQVLKLKLYCIIIARVKNIILYTHKSELHDIKAVITFIYMLVLESHY